MFGFGFGEFVVIAIVLLVVLGPKELPRFLRSIGQGVRKLRDMSGELRRQSGIDEVLREEGLAEDLESLRSLSRGRVVETFIESSSRPRPRAAVARGAVSVPLAEPGAVAATSALPASSVAEPAEPPDPRREYPEEGCDAYVAERAEPAPAASSAAPATSAGTAPTEAGT